MATVDTVSTSSPVQCPQSGPSESSLASCTARASVVDPGHINSCVMSFFQAIVVSFRYRKIQSKERETRRVYEEDNKKSMKKRGRRMRLKLDDEESTEDPPAEWMDGGRWWWQGARGTRFRLSRGRSLALSKWRAGKCDLTARAHLAQSQSAIIWMCVKSNAPQAAWYSKWVISIPGRKYPLGYPFDFAVCSIAKTTRRGRSSCRCTRAGGKLEA
jgi:hypothetical protein